MFKVFDWFGRSLGPNTLRGLRHVSSVYSLGSMLLGEGFAGLEVVRNWDRKWEVPRWSEHRSFIARFVSCAYLRNQHLNPTHQVLKLLVYIKLLILLKVVQSADGNHTHACT